MIKRRLFDATWKRFTDYGTMGYYGWPTFLSGLVHQPSAFPSLLDSDNTHSTSCYNNSQSQIFYSCAPTNGLFPSSFPVTCTRSQISEPLVRRTRPKDIGKPVFFVVNNIFFVGKPHDCWFHSSIPGSLGKPTPTSETECWLLIWFITQDIHRNPKPFKTA
jgi:hypothetical protein